MTRDEAERDQIMKSLMCSTQNFRNYPVGLGESMKGFRQG